MKQQPLPHINLATYQLAQIGESVREWDGRCADVAELVLKHYEGQLVYVDGDALDQYCWWYHAVPMIDGKIHDAWLEAWHKIPEPQTLEDWLVKMFGEEDEIEVGIDGKSIYKGLPQYFTPNKKV